MFKRILYLILVILTLSHSLISCGNKKIPSEDELPETIIFKDSLGRIVSVDQNPRRVAALIGSFADIWVLSGGTLCAAASDAWEDFGLDLGDAVNIGGAHSPSLELLLAADPDFVIASSSTASNVEMKEALENAGITVAYFDVDSFTDYLNMLNTCTNITGQKELYESNGIALYNQIEKIKTEFQHSDITAEEKRVLVLRASSTSLKAKGSSGTVLGEMLSDLGCINISDTESSLLENLTLESIIQNNPYHIFVVTMGDGTVYENARLQKFISDNPAWAELDAVKNNRFHIMDKVLFNLKPNSRWAEAYEKLSKILQSDQ